MRSSNDEQDRATIEEPGRKIAESELKAFERKVGENLPDDYRAFLLKYNGGRTNPDGYPVPDHEEQILPLQILYGIDRGVETSTLDWNLEQAQRQLPDLHVPIGRSDTGDWICLVLTKDRYGEVVFWDYQDQRGKDYTGNIYHVADSFTEFLNSLCDDE